MQNANTKEQDNTNRDPLTGAPGAHPVGTGLGAAMGGAAAGVAVGTVAGPVGVVIGAAAGAIIGGMAGKGVAEAMDPTVEYVYWRDHYTHRPYVSNGASFDDYGPAYLFGIHSSEKFGDRSFDDVEPELARYWDDARGSSSLAWERARNASRDAWERVRQSR